MPDARALLHANLHEVFSERDPDARWAAIERTYAEDVRFIDPDAEVVGRQALNDRAQELMDRAPADFVLEEPDARRAFLHTVRGIIDLGGQRVSARDRLYLAAEMPTLIAPPAWSPTAVSRARAASR